MIPLRRSLPAWLTFRINKTAYIVSANNLGSTPFHPRFISKIPIVPQINTPNPKTLVRIQLFPQVIIALHKQLNAITNAPYFACHFPNFEFFSSLKIINLQFYQYTNISLFYKSLLLFYTMELLK